ncbi:MAG TPA: AraC family transcriptional regulator [Clostridiaceae bacterium]|nr:AraC family transcriptional regulator [Clostridiaceae bacterium]
MIDVALEYQFDSPESFSRAFKREFGKNPTDFRKTGKPIQTLEQYLHTKVPPETNLTCLEYLHCTGISSVHGYQRQNLNIMTAHSFLSIINVQEPCSHSQKLTSMFLLLKSDF